MISWFFSVSAYVLAVGTMVLGGIEIYKDWHEYRTRWLRITVAAVFVVVAVVTIAGVAHERREKKDAEVKAETEMKRLQGKVDAASQAQADNTKQFLGAFKQMSNEIGDLETQVKTEALQKKLASVEADLQRTEQALNPEKAKLEFSFYPFPNPPFPQRVTPVTEIALPRSADGSVHVEFTLLNTTNVEAIDVNANLQICDKCKFARESPDLTKGAGASETLRFLQLATLHAREALTARSIDVIPPSTAQKFAVALSYRCRTCVVPATADSIWVTVR